jgi:hypothetical protein
MPGTYGKTWWREGYACGCMIQTVEDILEPRLRAAGYSTPVNIFQQAYNSSVSASAGTHSGGGALDHARASEGETRIWRECGVADWRRGSPYDSMDQHNHGVWIGCPHLSGDAADQVYDYKCGRNGLADNGSDPGPDVPYITWQDAYDKYNGTAGGVLGMTDIEKYHASKDQKFTGNDQWQTITIDDEGEGALSFLTGPKDAFVVVACYAWSGLEVGEVVQFRYQGVSDYSDNRATVVEWTYPIQESIASSGSTYGQIVWANSLGKSPKDDAKSRLRLFVSPPKGKTITLSDLTSRVLF